MIMISLIDPLSEIKDIKDKLKSHTCSVMKEVSDNRSPLEAQLKFRQRGCVQFYQSVNSAAGRISMCPRINSP